MIDYYAGVDLDYPAYKKLLAEKPYQVEEHFLPHDIEVKEQSTNKTRKELFKSMISDNITVVPRMADKQDGIIAVRTVFPKMWFDQTKCEDFLDALSQYRHEWKEKPGDWAKNPYHDWTSHPADMFQIFAMSYNRINLHDREESDRLDERRAEKRKGPRCK